MPHIYKLINESIDGSFAFDQKLYMYENGLKEAPKCKCGNSLNYKNKTIGYGYFCSKNCGSKYGKNKIYDTEEEENEAKRRKEYAKKYREENIEKARIGYIKNREKNLAKNKQNYLENRKEILAKIKERDIRGKRLKSDPIFKLGYSIGGLIRNYLKASGNKKSKRTQEILKCSREEFYVYIESKFDPEMNWDNYGTYWVLDHIKPMASATTEDEAYALNYHENFQPLTVTDNNTKKAKYDKNHPKGFDFEKFKLNQLEYIKTIIDYQKYNN